MDAGTRRFAYFASLPSGTYRFHVIACNEDGRWNEHGAVFAFTLLPFFYQQWWFHALCLFALIGLIGAVHHLRLARLKASERELQQRVTDALAKVKTLRGLMPICASCKKVRDDKGYWNQIEEYLREHSDTQVSHGICPDCIKKLHPEFADAVLREIQTGEDNAAGPPPRKLRLAAGLDEIRDGLDLRVVFDVAAGVLRGDFVGDHDGVQAYLRNRA